MNPRRPEFCNNANPLQIDGPLDEIYNLACPASPPRHQKDPIHTFRTGVDGTFSLLTLAESKGARILQSSTSEVYGDPAINLQHDGYRGNRIHRRTARAPIMLRKPGHFLVRPTSVTCRRMLPGNGSASSRAFSPRHRSWASSSFGSGRVKACSCVLSSRMDSRCESLSVRAMQQRRVEKEDIKNANTIQHD